MRWQRHGTPARSALQLSDIPTYIAGRYPPPRSYVRRTCMLRGLRTSLCTSTPSAPSWPKQQPTNSAPYSQPTSKLPVPKELPLRMLLPRLPTTTPKMTSVQAHRPHPQPHWPWPKFQTLTQIPNSSDVNPRDSSWRDQIDNAAGCLIPSVALLAVRCDESR